MFDVGVANYLARKTVKTLKGVEAVKSFEHFIFMEIIVYQSQFYMIIQNRFCHSLNPPYLLFMYRFSFVFFLYSERMSLVGSITALQDVRTY